MPNQILRRESMSDARFPLGQVVATPGALEAVKRNQAQPLTFLARHQSGDCGDLDSEDRAKNEYPVKHGFRLLSAYTLPDGTRIWVITEADRSSTCILLPDEY
jgi:hypothetical protein